MFLGAATAGTCDKLSIKWATTVVAYDSMNETETVIIIISIEIKQRDRSQERQKGCATGGVPSRSRVFGLEGYTHT